MLRVVGHIWSIGSESSPKGPQFPTTLPAPTAMGSTHFVCNVYGEPAHPVYLWCMFLSTHLHNPCLGRRGHDLSDDDNIMGLWLSGVHGQVVAHTGKDIGVVVPLNVLVVAIRGGLLYGTVSRSPAYRKSLRRGVVVTYVEVVLVFDYPFSFCRSGFNHTLVVEYDVVPCRASSKASAQAIVSARYTCWGPCTRKAAW